MPVDVRHWSYPEMAATFGFSLDQYLFFGGYPGVAEEISDLETWRTAVQRTIISPGIERDVIALSRVEKPALLRRLMVLGAEYSGQILSYNKMLGQLQEAGNTTTLADYLDLLSGAGLVTGLSGYSAAPYIARGSSPKLNVLNTALMTVPLKRSFEEVRADRTLWGRIVESAVGAHLHNTAGLAVDLHHWREGPHEIDFVLSRGTHPMGIEVKSGSRRGKRRGQEAFQERFPGARTLLVGERGVPLEEFLSKPARYWVDYEAGPPRVREPTPRYGGKTGVSAWNRPIVPGWKESEDYTKQAERRKFMADARQQVTVLERGEGSPWLWHRIGRAYMCAIPGHFNGDPTDTLRLQVESDERLLDSALKGLPGFVHRNDLPPLAEIVRLDGTKEGDSYSYPVLASLAETARLGGDPLCGLGREGITRAVGSYYLADYVKEPPWYPARGRQAPRPLRRRAGHGVPVAYPAPRQTQLPSLRPLRRRGIRRGGAAGGPGSVGRFPDSLHQAAGICAACAPVGRTALRPEGRAGGADSPAVRRARHGHRPAGALARGGAVHFREGIPPRGGGLRPDGAGTEGAPYPELSGARPARPPRPPRALGRLGNSGHRCTVQDHGPLVRPLVGQTRVALRGDDPQPEDRLASQALAGDPGGTSRGGRRGSTSIAQQVPRPGLLVR